MYKLNCSWVLLTEVIVLHPFKSLVHLNVELQKHNYQFINYQLKSKIGLFWQLLNGSHYDDDIQRYFSTSPFPLNTPSSAL